MIATRYYVDTNPIGVVSIAALIITLVLMAAITDEFGIPERFRRAVSLQLPLIFLIGGILCTPTKFVVGENIMGKIIFYVFVITSSIDLVGTGSFLRRTYGLLAGIIGVIALGNIFYQMIINEQFYHVTADSAVGIMGLAVLFIVGTPIQILIWRSVQNDNHDADGEH